MKEREKVITVLPKEDQEPMRKILTIMAVLLKVMQCDQEVDVVKVKEKAQEVMLVIADTYPWVKIQPTTHELY